ncbi:CcmD family protein [Maridesulfovibrio bastinii]|jgi:CcmD family protein|nr:CcmD family protein [Maridesulfovibrio bastinii]
MTNQIYLMVANVAVWIGIAGYVAFLGLKSVSIERRINQMEQLENDSEE